MRDKKMKAKDFINDATKYKKYFNIKIDSISAERSVKCKEGRL